MNWILTFTLGLTLLGGLCQTPESRQETRVEVPVPVAHLVQPVLDAMVAVRKAQTAGSPESAEWHKVEKLLARLMDDETPAGDEALVVLVQFYIGEATGEDLNHEITKRGRRMLPYLRKYRRGPAHIAGRGYPDSIRRDPQGWRDNIDTDIESIQQGKVMFED